MRQVSREGRQWEEKTMRQTGGPNIKAGFKGHTHFVLDDNHFPFVFSKCQSEHKAALFLIQLNSSHEHAELHVFLLTCSKLKSLLYSL